MRKILLNFGTRSLQTVGMGTYLSMVGTALLSSLSILQSRDLKSFDRRFGKKRGKTRFRVLGDKPFVLDLRAIDEMIVEPSYVFGLARELYFRRCYLVGHPGLSPEEMGTVVDLGANRGTFSAMCTPWARRIVMVEPLAKYNPCIAQCMADNGFRNYALHNCFIGTDTLGHADGPPVVPFDDLMRREQIDQIDFLKIDIEGGEFKLFEDGLPLERIARIAMEIHAPKGDPQPIVKKLRDAGFEVVVTDSEFRPLEDPRECEFLYGVNIRPLAPFRHPASKASLA